MDFATRLQNHDVQLKELLEDYMETAINSEKLVSQTTLTYLVVKTNTTFSPEQYKRILNLDETPYHSQIFQLFLTVVKRTALDLFETFGFPSLLHVPLTNLKDISYQVALTFKDICLVPIHSYVYELWDPFEGRDWSERTPNRVIKYISRFNEMWIITAMLNEEYNKLVEHGYT